MKIYLFISSLFSIIFTINTKNITSDSICSSENCHTGFGECVNNICLCGAGYTTVNLFTRQTEEITVNEYCNYDYKYKEYAAYFEAVMPFGVGHLYTRRYLHAVVKCVIFWFLSLNKIVFKKEIRLYPKIEKTNSYMLWVFALLYVVDYIGYSFDYYSDGNGIVLI